MKLSLEDQKRRDMAEIRHLMGPARLGQLETVAITALIPYAHNARTHDEKQLSVIERSIQTFGIVNPPLVDQNNLIIAGHGRVEAARRLGIAEIPVLRVGSLTPDQIRAYRLADNRIAELAGWDEGILAIELQHLCEVDIEGNIEVLGWDNPEIELLLDTHLNAGSDPDIEEEVPPLAEMPVSRLGDLWLCGRHRVLCGSALDGAALHHLMAGEQAQLVCQDPPWNCKVSSISGLGKIKHREFAMASGELSEAEFRKFLEDEIRGNAEHAKPGAVVQIFIDWRGIEKVIAAGTAAGLELINVCVWVKSNGGMSGGPWRSQHELIAVFKKPGGKIKNCVQLGRFGRYRTNVWQMAGQNSFGKERMEALESHPTRKPVHLIAEAIRDVTDRGDIVLDTFLGSGTALIAAERTGRAAYAMELDPLYVDTALRRFETLTAIEPVHAESRRTFAEVAAEREASPADNDHDKGAKPPVRTRRRVGAAS